MGRGRGGGGVGGGVKSPSMFGRILCRHVESLKKKNNYATVEQLVDHLRSTYPHYARLKLQPFTKRVHQFVHTSSIRNDIVSDCSNADEHEETAVRKKRKELDEREEKLQLIEAQHVIKRRNGVVLNSNSCSSSSVASAASSSSSSSEDDVSTSEDAEIDLMKSMLREKYCLKSKELEEVREVNEGVELEIVDNKYDNNVNLVNQKCKINLKSGKEEGGNGCRAATNNENSGRHIDESNGPKFKDLGGMSGVIEELKMEVIVPLYHPQLPRLLGVNPMAGILLHGPPGCGKTRLAHAIANETGVPFYKISATELVSGVSGASEENIRELFTKAYRTAPSIVFIDEIDAIASKRENLQREMERRIVTQLMTCMDESHRLVKAIDRNEGSESSDCRPGYVLVIGATNRPDAVDPALRRPGRFDREIVLGVPDESARVEILSVLTCNLRVEGAFDLVKLARCTPGFVGADLAALANKAGNLAMKRIIDQRKVLLSRESVDKEHSEDWWRHPWSCEEMEKLSITMADFEVCGQCRNKFSPFVTGKVKRLVMRGHLVHKCYSRLRGRRKRASCL